MSESDGTYAKNRDIWQDHNDRQEFEHLLIDRKTTWLLTTQAILFAGYGVSFDTENTEEGLESFRTAVEWSGLSIAAVILIGVIALIRSKYLSWTMYRDFFGKAENRELPRPLDGEPLEWGVRTLNTWFTLLPDVLLPIIFIVAWGCLILT